MLLKLNDAFDALEIAELIQAHCVNLAPGTEVSSLTAMSSEVIPGSLFVAVTGSGLDGHHFIPEALERGAAVCVVQDSDALGVGPGMVVADSRAALSKLAAKFSANSTDLLSIVGITGTNGKTTTAWIVSELLWSLGVANLRLGTLGADARGKVECQFNLTTPDPLTLHALFSRALSAEITAVVMEASSHALQQQRVADVAFDVGVFTNLTQDHLDYHGDMQSYLDAKMTLFTLVNRNQKGKRGAVVNVDSPEGCRVLEYCQKLDLNLIGFGRSELADLKMEEFSQSLAGSRFKVSYNGTSFQINSRFIGEHNAYNICGSLAVLELLGIGLRQSAPLCYELRQVPRLEAVGDETLGIYVDYAHTPDALLNVLSALRQLAKKKLWVVFGCGGDRDRSKRPVMAKVARELADKVIVTSDNPRSENPHTIISEILAGGVRADFVEVDRGLAINTAIHEAERGDVILIAGKGHEDYQIIGNEKLHFSDVEVARAAFIERKCA